MYRHRKGLLIGKEVYPVGRYVVLKGMLGAAQKCMFAFPGVLSYQISFLGNKFVVIGLACYQEVRRNALSHKVLLIFISYLRLGPV